MRDNFVNPLLGAIIEKKPKWQNTSHKSVVQEHLHT
uniref:Uncharacterized protein n=1 Tax=Trichinella nativa TaxID=6335 RepID=A0A0V1KI60_9BILA